MDDVDELADQLTRIVERHADAGFEAGWRAAMRVVSSHLARLGHPGLAAGLDQAEAELRDGLRHGEGSAVKPRIR